MATVEEVGLRWAPTPSWGADIARVGSHQPAPEGALGGALQLQRNGNHPASTGAASGARHWISSAATGQHNGWSSVTNPHVEDRLGPDSTARAYPLRAAKARWCPVPILQVGLAGTLAKTAAASIEPRLSHWSEPVHAVSTTFTERPTCKSMQIISRAICHDVGCSQGTWLRLPIPRSSSCERGG